MFSQRAVTFDPDTPRRNQKHPGNQRFTGRPNPMRNGVVSKISSLRLEYFDPKVVSKCIETKNTPTSGDPKLIGFGLISIYTFPWYVWLSVTPNIHEMAADLLSDLPRIAWLGQIPPQGTVKFSP